MAYEWEVIPQISFSPGTLFQEQQQLFDFRFAATISEQSLLRERIIENNNVSLHKKLTGLEQRINCHLLAVTATSG